MKDIKAILAERSVGSAITAKGWARTKRSTKGATFVELYDGSCFSGLQCVFDSGAAVPGLEATLARVTTGASLAVSGVLVDSPAAGQPVELKATSVEVIGDCPADSYPLQKKAHSLEFLREIAHLRPRTNTIGAAARMRDEMAYAV
ncbi:MAG TPA: OB-fold nucleic acid binding domain-containing protein, partial [Spirochaetales bacterium]|nr:OB-fold nucleic acid binding domain-containing protein [Spirochaetales bacterium]